MQVPFRLRRRQEAEPAAALLLPTHEAREVLALCARLRCDPLPPIFAVPDGFVLKLRQPFAGPAVGAVRLRGLGDNLFVPVDAELIPALLTDERSALGRQRGLVFLPGGRVLEFDPASPVAVSALLGVAELRREAWQPLPEPQAFAERLRQITLDLPEPPPEEILTPGGDGVGTEEPRPNDASAPKKALGQAALNVGKGLAWLGNKLGLKGLSAAGARWMASALALAPRLSEALLGKQEASLRDLLRDFQNGNIERALRRALPLGGDPARGSAPAQNNQLPIHKLLYSLGDLLDGSNGPGGYWFTRADIYQELHREYRKQAELAAQRGDYRRAAFIYGKLLNDYRAAAAVLARGGLHRDAALLYLKKLDDRSAAAREFEAAGEIDRALELYRQDGEHLLAGDLLRRVGEEDLAVAEYQVAAERLIVSGQGHYQAGKVLRTRARREDLALPYYRQGWERRPDGMPVPCALRLAQVFASTADLDSLRTLVDEADELLRQPGNDGPAGEFYNEVARLASVLPEPTRDDLRDRALLGIAGKIRQRSEQDRAQGAVSDMMGSSQRWPAAVVSDAEFAVKHEHRPALPQAAPIVKTRIPSRSGRVSAVCQAGENGCLFLGFESGEVVCFQPQLREFVTITDENAPIVSLAASEDGDTVVVLSMVGEDTYSLRSFSRFVGCYRVTGTAEFRDTDAPWLFPALVTAGEPVAGLWTELGVRLYQAQSLVARGHWPFASVRRYADAGMILVDAQGLAGLALCGAAGGIRVLLAAEMDWKTAASPWQLLLWQPCVPSGGLLRRPTPSWLFEGAGSFELAGITQERHVYLSRLRAHDGKIDPPTTRSYAQSACHATCILRPGQVAAVSATEVVWVRWTGSDTRPQVLGRTAVKLPGAVACFHHGRGKELIVVCGDGTLAQVPAVYA